MNPIFLKSLSGISLIGGATAISYGSYELFFGKTIKDQLIKNKKDPLDTSEKTDDNENWWKLIKDFVTENNLSTEVELSFQTKSDGDESKKQEDITALKNKCESWFKEKYSPKKEKTYKNAEKWCSKNPKN